MNIRWIFAISAASLASGCVTTNLAPGAGQVNITRNAADVAACTAVGNIPTEAGKVEKQRGWETTSKT